MIHNKPLIMDEIYPKIFKEHRLKEAINVRESARKVILRVLVLGSIKTGKTDIYLA